MRKILSVFLIVMAAWLMTLSALGQPTNNYDVSGLNGVSLESHEGFVKWGIMVLTPLIVYVMGRSNKLPRKLLALSAPVIGFLVGWGLDKVTAGLHVDLGNAALSGGAGVALREIWNNFVTKKKKPLEESKTNAKPSDGAVAVALIAQTAPASDGSPADKSPVV
jgi:hypothetical protein